MSKKPAVLALVAHPDDIEFMSMGAMLLLQQRGWDVHYMTIANGSCGTAVDDEETIVRKRIKECQEACDLVGAVWHAPVCNDLEIFHSWDIISKVLSVIRKVRPKIIFTQSLDDYMEDHINSCRVAVTAAFARGMLNAKCDPYREPIQDEVTIYHSTPHGLMDPLRRKIEPEVFVNVESVMQQKWDMLACHKSQKEWLDESQGMDSYLKVMQDFCAELGERSGKFKFAEGFRRHSWMGYSAREIDPLGEALGEDLALNPNYK